MTIIATNLKPISGGQQWVSKGRSDVEAGPDKCGRKTTVI